MNTRHVFSSAKKRAVALEVWHEARMAVGVHPFRKVWSYASWVSACPLLVLLFDGVLTRTGREGVDDSDFNLHMSNSSYAKALDSACFLLALATFPNIFRRGGWVPLAEMHYHFIREIPMLSRYEVRASFGAWDDGLPLCRASSLPRAYKYYPVHTPDLGNLALRPARLRFRPSNISKSPAENPKTPANPLVATLKTPATPRLLTPVSSTLFVATQSGGTSGHGVQPDADEVSKALLARGARELEPDDSLLRLRLAALLQSRAPHGAARGRAGCEEILCRACAHIDFRFLRIDFVLGGVLFHGLDRIDTSALRARTLPTRTLMPALKAFYAGGWRTERWWEEAFAACEGERQQRLRPLVEAEEGGKGGMTLGANAVGMGSWHRTDTCHDTCHGTCPSTCSGTKRIKILITI
ncbi:hypothetical protein FB451DRAFT_1560189 [Mycena latifolia]|nr:hypothetical protein FB451DRAFT_1560189 [Mycena latifolia]